MNVAFWAEIRRLAEIERALRSGHFAAASLLPRIVWPQRSS